MRLTFHERSVLRDHQNRIYLWIKRSHIGSKTSSYRLKIEIQIKAACGWEKFTNFVIQNVRSVHNEISGIDSFKKKVCSFCLPKISKKVLHPKGVKKRYQVKTKILICLLVPSIQKLFYALSLKFKHQSLWFSILSNSNQRSIKLARPKKFIMNHSAEQFSMFSFHGYQCCWLDGLT